MHEACWTCHVTRAPFGDPIPTWLGVALAALICAGIITLVALIAARLANPPRGGLA